MYKHRSIIRTTNDLEIIKLDSPDPAGVFLQGEREKGQKRTDR